MQDKGGESARSRMTLQLVAWCLQMLASLFWIASVFVYEGYHHGQSDYHHGDVLQLCAAIAWAMSNLAALPSILQLRRADPAAPLRVEAV